MSSSSDFEDPAEPAQNDEPEVQAREAAERLRDQIAAVRARVKDAQATLHEHARRRNEPRSFRKKDS